MLQTPIFEPFLANRKYFFEGSITFENPVPRKPVKKQVFLSWNLYELFLTEYGTSKGKMRTSDTICI